MAVAIRMDSNVRVANDHNLKSVLKKKSTNHNYLYTRKMVDVASANMRQYFHLLI